MAENMNETLVSEQLNTAVKEGSLEDALRAHIVVKRLVSRTTS